MTRIRQRTKYFMYIKEVVERNRKMEYGLTLREIIQTVRYRYNADHDLSYGW